MNIEPIAYFRSPLKSKFGVPRQSGIAPELMEETRTLFLTSDLVKFAKMTVSDEENVKAVPTAVRFVTATWKEEEKVEEKEGENVL